VAKLVPLDYETIVIRRAGTGHERWEAVTRNVEAGYFDTPQAALEWALQELPTPKELGY
jgi:hypothetical protein